VVAGVAEGVAGGIAASSETLRGATAVLPTGTSGTSDSWAAAICASASPAAQASVRSNRLVIVRATLGAPPWRFARPRAVSLPEASVPEPNAPDARADADRIDAFLADFAGRATIPGVTPIALLALLILAVVLLGVAEYASHARNLARIPIRVHVNGTRGKSSVVRLIAAALRAHGIKTFAKTTGTLPRLIADDGSELPVHRPGRTNIIEQLRIVGVAAREGASAIVLECMALQPPLQALSELELIRSTHGVVTNAWSDHLDVMGLGVRDVALALAGTTPVGGTLFTAERAHVDVLAAACRDRNAELVRVDDAPGLSVTTEEMERFTYVEHEENVRLALAVTSALGVPRDIAMRAMLGARPDVGALREFDVDFFGRRIAFVNGFAANDPVAAERVWRLTLDRHPAAGTRVMVINCRLDRQDRSRQLGQALAGWPGADHYLLIGSGTYALARTATSAGVSANALIPLEGKGAVEIFEEIMGVCGESAIVMGSGNIAGVGLELVRLFQNRASPRDARTGAT